MSGDDAMPEASSTEQTVRTFLDTVVVPGNVDRIDDLVSDDYVDRDPFPGQPPGRDGLRFEIETMRTAFPDLQIEYRLFVDGDTAVEEWRGRGTNSGAFLGNPATGRSIDYGGVSILEVRDGRISARRSYQDTSQIQAQLKGDHES